ncbi:MAG: restriction endonuclease subunit R, partial [Alphaproteobacteria bacterium]
KRPGDPLNAKEPLPPDYLPPVRATRIKVTLADGKERTIQSMVATSFWGPDGKPLSAAQFMESLFGALPAFFKDEAELRSLWSAPDTRKALLVGLADKGFGAAAMAEMQKLIEAEQSDLFDVLAYVAYTRTPIARSDRAALAQDASAMEFGDRQRAFIDFVLNQYVTQGVGELDSEKLSPLLKLRYKNAIDDALKDLGGAQEIRKLFVGFQRHLYTC